MYDDGICSRCSDTYSEPSSINVQSTASWPADEIGCNLSDLRARAGIWWHFLFSVVATVINLVQTQDSNSINIHSSGELIRQVSPNLSAIGVWLIGGGTWPAYLSQLERPLALSIQVPILSPLGCIAKGSTVEEKIGTWMNRNNNRKGLFAWAVAAAHLQQNK